MGKDYPDWGQSYPSSQFYPLDDDAEAVTRLGSPVVFDRRGNVIYIDDFRNGFSTWTPVTVGTDGAIVLAPDYALFGDFSVKLTAGRTLDRLASFHRVLAWHNLDTIGLEVRLAPGYYIDYFFIYIQIDDGITRYMARIKYSDADEKLYYQDEDGDYQEILASVDTAPVRESFHQFKIVADVANSKYMRVIMDGYEVDLADIPLYGSAKDVRRSLSIGVTLYSVVAGNGYAWLDSVVVTMGEPA